jgi:hypothetical protein
MMASLKKKEADDSSRDLAETCHRITRVVRKPHGWKPVWKEVSEPPGEVFEDGEEVERSRLLGTSLGWR